MNSLLSLKSLLRAVKGLCYTYGNKIRWTDNKHKRAEEHCWCCCPHCLPPELFSAPNTIKLFLWTNLPDLDGTNIYAAYVSFCEESCNSKAFHQNFSPCKRYFQTFWQFVGLHLVIKKHHYSQTCVSFFLLLSGFILIECYFVSKTVINKAINHSNGHSKGLFCTL